MLLKDFDEIEPPGLMMNCFEEEGLMTENMIEPPKIAPNRSRLATPCALIALSFHHKPFGKIGDEYPA